MPKHTIKKNTPSSNSSHLRILLCICLMACSLFVLQQIWPVPSFDSYGMAESTDSSPEMTLIDSEIFRAKIYPEAKEGFLPICHGRRTGQKMVALTIDDCNQLKNLQEIVRLIAQYNGKATIFPIGENVSFLAPVLKSAVRQGFEIENHTQTHSGLYSETDEELAYQIWQQNREVSQALGVNYQMHFLRPRGGDNRLDQRTHAYMRQMGYLGMAYWSQVGSGSTAETIMANLRQGDIILFHTTDEDLAILQELVPLLYANGWRMVTLNELYDLPENEQTPLTDAMDTPPALLDYQRIEQTYQKGDYLYDVLRLQYRLTSLGYLNDKCDGCFGAKTERAVRAFQQDAGLTVTGICDPLTWDALFAP